MCEPSARCAITDHGLRCTQQREAVFDALMQASDHPTADTLHSRVCGVSKATVYNALEAFARVGLAQAIPGPGGVTRWDAVTGPHVHVRHIDDDRVEDLPDPLATQVLAGMTPEVIDHIEASLGVHVDAVQVSLLVREA